MVEIAKVMEVDPAGTVIVAGTVAAKLALPRVTTAPPAGAEPVSVIVPFEDTPPTTLGGLTVSFEAVACWTVRGAVNATAL
jgi:hypothetical protein